MIYTLCLSPAIDYNMYIDKVVVDGINKSNSETFHAGGKGINVSIVLKNLGVESVCLGFLGGFTGKYIKDYLDSKKIKNDFVWIDSDTRINVKIKGITGETAIDGMGPVVKRHFLDELFIKLDKLKHGDMLVLSGNTCKGVNETIYEEILSRIDKDVVVVVDSVRYLLYSSLKYKPLFIKPNKDELEEVLNVKISNERDLVSASLKLKELGAQNVIVSLGKDGAMLLDSKKHIYFIKSNSQKEVVNTIGCGDSVVAGVIAKYLKNNDMKEATMYGVASGTASAYSEHFGVVEDIEDIYKNKLEVKEFIY